MTANAAGAALTAVRAILAKADRLATPDHDPLWTITDSQGAAILTVGYLRAVIDEAKAEALQDLSESLLKQRDGISYLSSATNNGRRLGLEDAARIARSFADALTLPLEPDGGLGRDAGGAR